MIRLSRYLIPGVFACIAGIAAGCGPPAEQGSLNRTPKQTRIEHIESMLEPNVTGVAMFWDPFDPYIWDEDRVHARGLRIQALYLTGGERGLGVFGDGVIRPQLFVLERQPDGTGKYELIKEWTFDVEAAKRWRCKPETAMGYGYLLPLVWDGLETDLTGRRIRFVVAFERTDGIVVRSKMKELVVPGRRPSPAS